MKAELFSMVLGTTAMFTVSGTQMWKPTGAECTSDSECGEASLCYRQAEGAAVCMNSCKADDRICAGDVPCLPSATRKEEFVCYTGGKKPLEASCKSNTECERGVCVEHQGERTCKKACHLDDPMTCGQAAYCTPIQGSNSVAGFCSKAQSFRSKDLGSKDFSSSDFRAENSKSI